MFYFTIYTVLYHWKINFTALCSEACANVIEVQLSEERAKVEALKQQVQTLQVMLNIHMIVITLVAYHIQFFAAIAIVFSL